MGKKREVEQKILKEMDEAMKEQGHSEEKTSKKYALFGLVEDKTPEKVHCKKCRTWLENGVCPTCGFHIYTPMDEGKKKKIRLIVGGVCIALFLGLFLWLQFS